MKDPLRHGVVPERTSGAEMVITLSGELVPNKVRSSSGLFTPCPPCCKTWVYIIVVETSLCPIKA